MTLAKVALVTSCIAVLLAGFSTPCPAHTLDAPAQVVADPDGRFSYEAVFTAGPGSAFLAAATWLGVENVTGGLVGDCFCLPECVLAESETITIVVDGRLDAPELPGSVSTYFELCDEPLVAAETDILPFIVPVEAESWGAIKALFD